MPVDRPVRHPQRWTTRNRAVPRDPGGNAVVIYGPR